MRPTTVSSKWKLHNTFDALAPSREDVRARLFVGREHELQMIDDHLSALDRAVLIYGYFGIGKTMLMREALSRITKRNPSIMGVYTHFLAGTTLKECALFAMAESLNDLGNERANNILHLLRGGSITTERGARATFERGDIKNIDQALRELRSQVEAQRVIVAIDDIERRADIALIREMIDDIRALRDYEYSVIVPGHPDNATNILRTGSYGMLIPVELKQMQADELVQVMYKYLELGRPISRDDLYPFSDEAADMIAKRFAHPENTVREFVVACFHILEEAVSVAGERIQVEDVEEIWPRIAPRILAAVDDHDHALRILKLLHEQGGEITEDADYDFIRAVLGRTGGFTDALHELRRLVESTLLSQSNDGNVTRVTLNETILDDEILDKLLSEE